jgi:hypothetical protein
VINWVKPDESDDDDDSEPVVTTSNVKPKEDDNKPGYQVKLDTPLTSNASVAALGPKITTTED